MEQAIKGITTSQIRYDLMEAFEEVSVMWVE